MECWDANLQVLELLLRPFDVPSSNATSGAEDGDGGVVSDDGVEGTAEANVTTSHVPAWPGSVNWVWYRDGTAPPGAGGGTGAGGVHAGDEDDRKAKRGGQIYNHWSQVSACCLDYGKPTRVCGLAGRRFPFGALYACG